MAKIRKARKEELHGLLTFDRESEIRQAAETYGVSASKLRGAVEEELLRHLARGIAATELRAVLETSPRRPPVSPETLRQLAEDQREFLRKAREKSGPTKKTSNS